MEYKRRCGGILIGVGGEEAGRGCASLANLRGLTSAPPIHSTTSQNRPYQLLTKSSTTAAAYFKTACPSNRSQRF
ncbi:hypothetical protein BC567DRAFT_71617 [Phyllosticta citribraziliensis]